MDMHEAQQIFEEVKANHRKLDSCGRHSFTIDLAPERPLGKKWKCSQCGGAVDTMAKVWYERGIAHSAKE